MRTCNHRLRPAPAGRTLYALLVVLSAVLGPGLPAQEGRSFVDLLIAEEYTTFLLFNRGNGTFVLEDYGFDYCDGVAAGDFDKDGDVDFAILTGLFLGHGDFSFGYLNFAREDIHLCRNTENFFELADMDADGLMDVVLGCLDTVVIYYGTGDERVIERGTVLRSGATYREDQEGPTILAVGDMNDDGLPDLKMGQTIFGIQFFLNEGGRSYRPIRDDLPEGHVLRGSSGVERWIDFNGDQHLDIVTPYAFCLGDGKFDFACTKFEYPEGIVGGVTIETVDIDGDEVLDVVTLNPSWRGGEMKLQLR